MTRVSPEGRPSAREVSQAAVILGGGPPLEQSARQPLPPALTLIVSDDQPTGPTKEVTVPGEQSPAPPHRAWRLRRAALATMAAAAVVMIAIAEFSTFALAPDSAGRVASRMSADEVFTPPTPETGEPTESDQTGTESESDPVDDPVNDVGDDEHKSNPNKGPGNNSGDRKDDKDDNKGK